MRELLSKKVKASLMGRPATQDGSLTLFTLINGLYFIMLAELFLGDPLSLDITQA